MKRNRMIPMVFLLLLVCSACPLRAQVESPYAGGGGLGPCWPSDFSVSSGVPSSFTYNGVNHNVVSTYAGILIQTDGAHYNYHPAPLATYSKYNGFCITNVQFWMTRDITPSQYNDGIGLFDFGNQYIGAPVSTGSVRIQIDPASYGLALVADPSVIKINGTYMMYMTGTTDHTGYTGNNVYLFTSTDGSTWSGPTLTLSETSGWGIGEPSVIYGAKPGLYEMWAHDNTLNEIKYATSTDGVIWTVMGTSGTTALAYDYWLSAYIALNWDGDGGIILYLSGDGINWTSLPAAVFQVSSPFFPPPPTQYPRGIRLMRDSSGINAGSGPQFSHSTLVYHFTVGPSNPFNWSIGYGMATIN